MSERFDRWIQTFTICMMLGFLAFTTKQCSDNLGSNFSVIQYDGFENSCEKNGGVVHDGKCFDTDALIEVDVEELDKKDEQ